MPYLLGHVATGQATSVRDIAVVHGTRSTRLFARACVCLCVCVRRLTPARNRRLLGLDVCFLLRVRDVPVSIPGAALVNQPPTLVRRIGAYLLACHWVNHQHVLLRGA